MKNHSEIKTVLVTGGAGYVGAVLVPHLLKSGYDVRVLDLYIYGESVLNEVKDHPNLRQIKGDIRDTSTLRKCIVGCDAVIHLACISNDPTVELDPDLSRTINYESFGPLVRISKESEVKQFIFASSGSVYGVSDAPEVTEEHPLVPISLYNKFKGMCEPIILKAQSPDFNTTVIRPATICGYSPRQRLDLTVNILTTHAYCNNRITVFGGKQTRPNIHILDIVDLYTMLLEAPRELIAGQIFNAGYQNYSIAEIANIVKKVVSAEVPDKKDIDIVTTPSNDPRSYHISSKKIQRILGFTPKRTIEDGVRDLLKAFKEDKIPNPLHETHYYNIKMMKQINLK